MSKNRINCRAQGCRKRIKTKYKINGIGWLTLCNSHQYQDVQLKPHPGNPIFKYLPFYNPEKDYSKR